MSALPKVLKAFSPLPSPAIAGYCALIEAICFQKSYTEFTIGWNHSKTKERKHRDRGM